MNVTTNRDELAEVLTSASAVTDRRTPLTSSVLLEAGPSGLRVSASDFTMACALPLVAQVDDPGASVVDAATMLQIVRAMPGDSVRLRGTPTRLNVSSGDSEYKLNAMAADDFPPMPEFLAVCSAALNRSDFLRLLDQTAFAVATDDVRFGLNGAHVEEEDGYIRLVATDGHRLARSSAPFQGGVAWPARSLISRRTLAALRRAVPADGLVVVEFGADAIAVAGFWFRLIEGEFPDYRAVMPTDHNHRVVVDRDALAAACKRVAIVASGRGLRAVRFAFDAGGVAITAETAERGGAAERVACELEGKPIAVGLNLRYLTEALAAVGSERVVFEIGHALSPVALRGEGDERADFLLMPMRVD